MAVEAVEATESLPKEAGLVGLDGPLDELDLTKMLVENFENNGPEETSPSGDAVEEAEPVEESTEEAGDTEHVLSQEESETESEVEAEPEQAEPEGEQEEPEWLRNRNGFNVGLIASPENFGWRRRSATNWRRKSSR